MTMDRLLTRILLSTLLRRLRRLCPLDPLQDMDLFTGQLEINFTCMEERKALRCRTWLTFGSTPLAIKLGLGFLV
jgi:hypothetical protein